MDAARTPPRSTAATAVEVEILDAGPLVGRVAVRRTFGPSTSTVTYELRAGSGQLLVHVELDWHHDEHLLSMAFPIDVRADDASCDVQFGVVAATDASVEPLGRGEVRGLCPPLRRPVGPDFGVAVLNDGRFGHSVFDGAIRVSLARAAKYPDPGADHGRHQVTLAIRPHGAGLGDVRDAAAG